MTIRVKGMAARNKLTYKNVIYYTSIIVPS